jgi:hypothetical protein
MGISAGISVVGAAAVGGAGLGDGTVAGLE